jgi:hypothetical protein
MTEPATVDVWMIEVLSDGTGQRHSRYLVAAHHREAAISAVRHYLSTELFVTSATKLDGDAAKVCEMKPGDVRGV